MFEITQCGDNRIDMSFGGKLDSEEMKALLDEFVDKTKDVENGTMLYTIHDFDFPTLSAIGEELTRLPELFRHTRKFKKVAVLAEQQWIRKVSELEGMLFPGLDIKGFPPNDTENAEAWLTQ
ncbi:STAS/SEC14 domain-containing protein [Photobacterium frigidiphilum]|uniref:STAS/SEC14 domain-containing protein n=1 Tax=Photobacterium frigidiphilum TaxID=264736 RepID=UPI0030039743